MAFVYFTLYIPINGDLIITILDNFYNPVMSVYSGVPTALTGDIYVDLSGLQTGPYFIRFEIPSIPGEVLTLPFIKQ